MKNIINITKATVSSKGQVVIPTILRNYLGIHAGSEITLKLRDDGVCELQPIKRNIKMFFGRGKSNKSNRKILSVEEMDKLILKAVKDNDRS